MDRQLDFLARLPPRATDLVIPAMLCNEPAMERSIMECEDRLVKYRLQLDQLFREYMQLVQDEANAQIVLEHFRLEDRENNDVVVVISRVCKLRRLRMDTINVDLRCIYNTIDNIYKVKAALTKSQQECRNDLKSFCSILAETK